MGMYGAFSLFRLSIHIIDPVYSVAVLIQPVHFRFMNLLDLVITTLHQIEKFMIQLNRIHVGYSYKESINFQFLLNIYL
jgi:hypothetical protein